MENMIPPESQEHLSAIESIGYEALAEVAHAYGDGSGSIRPEVRDLAYHNLNHTTRVQNAARTLARDMQLSPYDQALAATIASAHDVIHDRIDDILPESASAAWLTTRMQEMHLPAEDIEIAELAIMSTVCTLDDQGRLLQYYGQIMFPNERSAQIAACVASADMEALASAHGPRVGHDLFRERLGYKAQELPPSLDDLAAFQEEQVQLLDTYSYPYPGAELLFGGLRRHAYLFHLSLLQDIEQGRITTWQQVAQADEAFYNQYA